MKKYLIITFFLLTKFLFAQADFGGIKTTNGFLLYANDGVNSYTLNLEDEFNIDNFPMFIQNGNLYQFVVNDKNDFGSENKESLIQFMNWEFEHFKKQLNGISLEKNNFTNNDNKLFNHWKITLPQLDGIKKAFKATYFLDFVHQDYIYRISYSSLTGNDKEAKILLDKMYNQIRFYNGTLDLNKLRSNVLNGINYYN